MDTHKLFSDFDLKIKLNKSKIKTLKTNRKALREKIRDHFKNNGWGTPRFYSQGSFPLNTNLNPIKNEKYDLDDGVYFICSEADRKESATYHDRIKKAVDGHAENVIDKNTCVRVVYGDGHHIDLPSYWLEKEDDVPQLAHKSKDFIASDPKAFNEWVKDRISNANNNDQLRRCIRYFKAWEDYRADENSSLRLPSGFILTILTCQNFSKDDRDDLAFKNTVEAIKEVLDFEFTCYRPTVPTDEDLLGKYTKETVLKELQDLVDNAREAIDSDCEKKASEFWRKVFGSRFPLGAEESKQSVAKKPVRVSINRPWSER